MNVHDDALVAPPPVTSGDTPVRSRNNTPLRHDGVSSPLVRRIVSPLLANTRGGGASGTPTQRRYESPVQCTTPNRVSIRHDVVENAGGRIRPGFFGGHGPRILEERGSRSPPRTTAVPVVRSSKQGPSHRKLRRWNNDRLLGIASEIAKANQQKNGEALARAFLEGEAQAHLFAQPHYPLHHRSVFATLSTDDSKRSMEVKERYLRGEVAVQLPRNTRTQQKRMNKNELPTGDDLFRRIPQRLANILKKTCLNDTTTTATTNDLHTSLAVRVISTFERHLMAVMDRAWQDAGAVVHNTGAAVPDDDAWNNILRRPPDVSRSGGRHHNGGSSTATTEVRYHFHADSSRAAYHRLLLHAVCHFHGLRSGSDDDVDDPHTRIMTVTGTCHGAHLRLVEHVRACGGGNDRPTVTGVA